PVTRHRRPPGHVGAEQRQPPPRGTARPSRLPRAPRRPWRSPGSARGLDTLFGDAHSEATAEAVAPGAARGLVARVLGGADRGTGWVPAAVLRPRRPWPEGGGSRGGAR